jgi:hypothetical protein
MTMALTVTGSRKFCTYAYTHNASVASRTGQIVIDVLHECQQSREEDSPTTLKQVKTRHGGPSCDLSAHLRQIQWPPPVHKRLPLTSLALHATRMKKLSVIAYCDVLVATELPTALEIANAVTGERTNHVARHFETLRHLAAL